MRLDSGTGAMVAVISKEWRCFGGDDRRHAGIWCQSSRRREFCVWNFVFRKVVKILDEKSGFVKKELF